MHGTGCGLQPYMFALTLHLQIFQPILAMVHFQDVDELRAHLLGWEAVYGEYAEVLWEAGGIRSTEMIAGYTPVVLADILAAGGPLLPFHTGRAHDMISRVTSGVLHGVQTYWQYSTAIRLRWA